MLAGIKMTDVASIEGKSDFLPIWCTILCWRYHFYLLWHNFFGRNLGCGDGKWRKPAEKVVAVFDQKTALLTGSILTTTGDLRFLKILFSVKNSNYQLLVAQPLICLKADLPMITHLQAIVPLVNRPQFQENMTALPNAYNVTYLKPGFSSVAFTFPEIWKANFVGRSCIHGESSDCNYFEALVPQLSRWE